MESRDQPEQAPGTDDALRQSEEHEPSHRRSPGASYLDNFLKAMNAAGDGTDASYEAALRDIRRNADDVVVEIIKRFSACHDHDYPYRWALVYAAAQLESSAALPFLRSLVLTPIPPEQSPSQHSFSTVGQETILRTTAIEAVGSLAQKEQAKARDALFEFLDVPSISIRRAAVQSLLSLDEDLREELEERLPRNAHHLLDLRAAEVTEVTQIEDPKRHLKERIAKKPAPPSLEDEGPETQQSEKGPRTNR